jgi:hypothetical protein
MVCIKQNGPKDNRLAGVVSMDPDNIYLTYFNGTGLTKPIACAAFDNKSLLVNSKVRDEKQGNDHSLVILIKAMLGELILYDLDH